MMNLKKAYHFLGSIHFAITLITSVAILTIAGTFIESKTNSHRYAAALTYENPFFIFLLWCFFINILVSALRRWPFKMRHIPFLITHTGLLMILGGVLVKSYFGTQGSMAIMEGSASHEILQPGTYMVQLDPFGEKNRAHQYAITQNFLGRFHLKNLTEANLKLELVNYFPHSKESFQTWVRESQGFISGLAPFPVFEWNQNQQNLPISMQIDPWEVYAFHTTDPSELIKTAYLQGMKIRLIDRLTEEVIFQGLLSKALEESITLLNGEAKVDLSVNFSALEGLVEPKLTLSIPNLDPIEIFLSGTKSLINHRQLQILGNSPLVVDLERTPALLFVEDHDSDLFLFAFDAHGRMHNQIFRQGALNPIIVYGNGFGGYAVQTDIPFSNQVGRKEIETAQQNLLVEQFEENMDKNLQLAAPLALFQNACSDTKHKFVENCIAFLAHWNNSSSWLYPENLPLPKNLENIFAALSFSHEEQKACHWVSQVFQEIEPRLKQGKEVGVILEEIQWPLVASLKSIHDSDAGSLLRLLSQQIFAASNLLSYTDSDETLSPSKKAHLLSAYLRVFGIHWAEIAALPSVNLETLTMEAPLTSIRKKTSPSKKIEENLPMITLRAYQENKTQSFSLTYDPFASGLRWPILGGKYLVRFQPQFKKIPYKVRLRNARQINYANSTQPYSFESDLIVTDLRTNLPVEKTISMNQVYETWDGYRFYLANIAPPAETSVRQVQIVVNHDPAKYWLTYPGAIILTFGIFLLFWIRPYRK